MLNYDKTNHRKHVAYTGGKKSLVHDSSQGFAIDNAQHGLLTVHESQNLLDRFPLRKNRNGLPTEGAEKALKLGSIPHVDNSDICGRLNLQVLACSLCRWVSNNTK